MGHASRIVGSTYISPFQRGLNQTRLRFSLFCALIVVSVVQSSYRPSDSAHAYHPSRAACFTDQLLSPSLAHHSSNNSGAFVLRFHFLFEPLATSPSGTVRNLSRSI